MSIKHDQAEGSTPREKLEAPPTRRKALAAEKVKAGLAEVARRHRRKRAPVTKLEQTLSLWRNQLIRLLDRRGGLHDDDAGRADLRVLLELRLSGPKAVKVAPWISPPELHRLIDDVDALPHYWKAGELADRFEITFEEKIDPDLDIRNIPCFDRPKQEVDAFYEQRRRERGTERKRLHRAIEKKKPKASIQTHDDLSLRTGAVLAWLRANGGSCSLIEHIVDGFGHGTEHVPGVGALREFEGLSRPSSKRKAVWRAVHELDKAGFAEISTGRDHYRGRFNYPVLGVRIRRDEASEA
jgi:hypothetical protein